MARPGPLRPCIEPGCPKLATRGQARCAPHLQQREGIKNRRRRTLAPSNGAARQTRRALNRAGYAQCQGPHHQGKRTLPARHLEVDHITALEDEGTDTPDNIQVLCRPCHTTKSTAENRARAARR